MSTEYDNDMNPGEQNPGEQNTGSNAPEGTVSSGSANDGYYHYIRPAEQTQNVAASQTAAENPNPAANTGFTGQQNPAGNTWSGNAAADSAAAANTADGYGGYGYRRPEQQGYTGYQQSTGYQQNTSYQQSAGYQQNTGYQQTGGYSSAGTGAYTTAQYASGQTSGGTKPPKKPGKAVKIVALALACVLVGGAAGGGIAAVTMHHSSKADTKDEQMAASSTQIESSTTEIGGKADSAAERAESAAEETTGDTAEQKDDAFQQTTISINSNAETNELVPQDVYENYVNAVVAISNEGTTSNIFGQTVESASSGSGMIISSDGYILTNNHVVEDAQTLTVTMTDGNTYDATVIGADSVNDVALIKIDATDLPTVSIGDSDSIAVGQQVCAIGNPLGELTNTLTVGYVSALDREIYESSTGTSINMFQTDCAINSGNSGGPIFDMSGNVIGITTAKYSSSATSSSASIEGIGFCIPINDAMDIVNDFLTYGYVRGRPSIGITCQNISSTVTQYYNLPVGVYVVSVTEGSGAENAGLQEGDIITSINGTAVESVSELKSELKNYEPGDSVELEVYRSGETTKVTVVLDESISTSTSTDSSSDASGSTDGSDGSEGDQSQGDQSQQTNPFSGFNFSYGY